MKDLHTRSLTYIIVGLDIWPVEMEMATLSEAIQQKLRRKDCPFLHDCGVQVTKDYFTRICNSAAYINCHHFAKRVGELRRPMTWLQKLAVDQARMIEQSVEAH